MPLISDIDHIVYFQSNLLSIFPQCLKSLKLDIISLKLDIIAHLEFNIIIKLRAWVNWPVFVYAIHLYKLARSLGKKEGLSV